MSEDLKFERVAPPRRRWFGLDSRRQSLYAAITLAAVVGGYWVGRHLGDGEPPSAAPSPETVAGPATPTPDARPWYQEQSPAPSFVMTPDLPLFPDPIPGTEGEDLRAYEDVLPHEIHEPVPHAPLVAPEPPPPPAAVPEVASLPEPALPSIATPADEGVLAPESPPVGADALPPWRLYAAATQDSQDKPMIAVVIDDMGVDRHRSSRVVALPPPMTVSYLSYAPDLEHQAIAARAAGHEVLLHVPMEPANAKLDPGPGALLTNQTPEEMRTHLLQGLARFHAFVGINNHMGSKFTTDGVAMTLVLDELRRRGLLFLDSRTSAATVGVSLARGMGIPTAERNVFLDNVNEPGAVAARLAETEKLALRIGYAVAIGHPRDGTVEALETWLPQARAGGYVVVPVSALVNRRPRLAQAGP